MELLICVFNVMKMDFLLFSMVIFVIIFSKITIVKIKFVSKGQILRGDSIISLLELHGLNINFLS